MDEDIALPRATLSKLIKDCISGRDLRISAETTDIVVECCGEFVRMLYTQANEICTHEDKNTIIADHVIKALEQLELHSWIEPVEQALVEFKESSKANKTNKPKMSAQEMVDLQDKLFADARARNASTGLLASTDLGQSAELPPVDACAMMGATESGMAEDAT
eukprot:jgi/Ulvmu1/10554/UM065_0008.1